MGVCDVPVISNVCDAAGEAAGTLVAAPFDWLAQAMGAAAGWLMETMWTVFDTTTMVDLTQDGYVSVYNLLFGLGVLVVLIFFCLQLITGLIKRDPSALSRAATGAAKSILGSFLVLTLMGTLLEIVDQLCIGLIQAAGESTGSMGDKLILLTAGLTTINVSAPGVGAIVTIFLAGLMVSAVAIVWFSLLIRKALLLVGIALAPLALSGAAWDATRGWIGKWLAFVIALAVSKLVLVIVFLIAITQMATPIEADLQAVTEPVTGIVLLLIAAFAPYMVYRFISFLGFDLYNAMGAEQETKSAMNRPIPKPNPGKPDQGEGPNKVLDGKDQGGKSGGGGGGDGGASQTAAPSASGSGGSAGAGATGSGGGAGAAGAGGGAAAAGGPIAAGAVVGAKVLKGSAEAGPKAGKKIGADAEAQAGAAGDSSDTSPTSSSGSSPKPATPPASGKPGDATPAGSTPPPAQTPPPQAPTEPAQNGQAPGSNPGQSSPPSRQSSQQPQPSAPPRKDAEQIKGEK